MRDYALNRAASVEATGAASIISRLIRNWRARRAVTRLESFDDYMLRDIGVTRADVEWASGLPLSVNAALELEQRSIQRRKGLRND
jgi:uncharacterized protein YjiS (DUF1127 family)